jgi:hypothetical protein
MIGEIATLHLVFAATVDPMLSEMRVTPRLAALLLPQMSPAFSVLPASPAGASPPSVPRRTFKTRTNEGSGRRRRGRR